MRNALAGALTTAAGALATGYALAGHAGWAGFWLLLGAAWWFARRRWRGVGSLVFFVFTMAASGGMLAHLGAGWMLLGSVAALIAWDLDDFVHELQEAPRRKQEGRLIRAHLQRLIWVGGGGLALGGLALLSSVRLGVGLAVALGLLAVVGLQQFFALLRGESD
ncbi:MAG: hypothetical protein ACP5HM_05455 [Anaerolineae bacterium]